MTDIHRDGYIILRNALTENDIQSALSCTYDRKVEYQSMKKFIDDIFFPTIKKNQRFITNPQYVKFRYSNNNNSKDASLFHGDIYNHSDIDVLPIYTCLCYFDDTRMEIIPKTHINSKDLSIQSYFKKIEVPLHRGDILIFHSNIHHRGVNFDKEGDRRLLQVFDVFPDMETYRKHSPKLAIVKPTYIPKLGSQIIYEISKFPFVIDTMSFFHYNFMYYDLQYKVTMNDISPSDKNGRYISYEPNQRAFLTDVDVTDENINIICDRTIQTMPDSNYYRFVGILHFLLLIAVFYILYKAWFSDCNSTFRAYTAHHARKFYILRLIRSEYKRLFY